MPVTLAHHGLAVGAIHAAAGSCGERNCHFRKSGGRAEHHRRGRGRDLAGCLAEFFPCLAVIGAEHDAGPIAWAGLRRLLLLVRRKIYLRSRSGPDTALDYNPVDLESGIASGQFKLQPAFRTPKIHIAESVVVDQQLAIDLVCDAGIA